MLESISLLLITATVLGNFLLGLLVLRNNPKKLINQIYFTFVFFLILWIFSSYTLDENIGEYLQIALLRVAYISGIIAAFLLYVFVKLYPNDVFFTMKDRILLIVVIFFSLISALTDLIVIPIESMPGAFYFTEGALYSLYVMLIISFLFGSIYLLLFKLYKSTGIERLQITYITMGVVIPILFISTFVLFIPLFNPNMSKSEFMTRVTLHRISLATTLIYTFFTTYAIIRHRLFGIRVILGELVFWIAGSALTFLFFYATVLLELRIFGNFTDPVVVLLNIVIALLAFPLLRSTNNHIRRLIRRFTINVTFDQEHVLKEYTTEIVQSESTEDIVTRLFNVSDDCYHPSSTGILLIDQETGNITSQWRGLTTEEIAKIEDEDTINSLINSVGTRPDTMLKVDAVLPITLKRYAGVCVLGAKKGNETYTSEDVRFLEQILETTALNLNRTIK